MERKTHEALRDKAFEQFLEEEKKNEGKEVDELTSYTYGQRARKEGNRAQEEEEQYGKATDAGDSIR